MVNWTLRASVPAYSFSSLLGSCCVPPTPCEMSRHATDKALRSEPQNAEKGVGCRLYRLLLGNIAGQI